MKIYRTRIGYIAGVVGETYKGIWREEKPWSRDDLLDPATHFTAICMPIMESFRKRARDPVTGDYVIETRND